MPQYRYDAPEPNRFAGTIGDILREQGQIAARRAEQVGQIQARAAEQGGQAWAGAVQNIGQIPQQVQQQKRVSQQDEANALQIGEQKRAIAARNAFAQIIKDTPQLDEDGVSLYDVPAVAKQLAAAGQDPGDAVKHLGGINEAFRAEKAAKMALVKRGAEGIIAAGNDPTLAGHFLDQLEKNGTYSTEKVGQFRQFIAADPKNVGKLTAMLVGERPKPTVMKPGEVAFDPNTQQPIPGMSVPEDPAKGAYTGPDGVRYKSDGSPLTGDVMTPQAPPAAAQTHNMRLAGVGDVPVDYVPAKDGSGGRWMYQGKDVSGQVKAIPAASIQIHNQNANAPDMPAWALDDSRPAGDGKNALDPKLRMTPNGLFQAAQTYIATGQFPPTGRSNDPIAVAQRAAVTSKAGAIAAASGMDAPTLRAFYKSNATSLGQQQKMYDAVQGFMATADKNSVLLEKSLEKIPDTGVPAFNKPLRSFMKDVAGDANLSQFGTYLQSVQNEYGRIISQPNLAGQLTDSARHEAEALLDPKATVPQILASIKALRGEGDNRLVSVGEQIQRIQTRMQGGATASNAPIKVGGFTVVVK